MFILDHIKPENATGKVAEAYAVFPAQVPVPAPLVMMSASPELAYLQSQIIRYYMNHTTLDMELLSMIRYLVANAYDYPFCIQLNAGILKLAGGLNEAELQSLKTDPASAPLDEARKALLLFVLKVVKTPKEVTRQDVDRLRQLGWSDQAIFDAAYHGTSMVGPSLLFKAFDK